MARGNYCTLFRFDNQYCDVFQEDDHYLYAEAEYGNYNGFMVCNEWHEVKNLHGESEMIRHDASNADAAYLETLEYAPEEVAADIIQREYARALYYMTRGESCHWYGYSEPPTMAECIEDARGNAGIIY